MHTKVYYDMKLTDVKTGKVVKKFRKRICHSFVKQFMQLLNSAMGGRTISLKDTGNTTRTTSYRGDQTVYSFAANAGATATTFGSIVGTNNTAPTINDYVLGTPIAHGTGAGQLQYSAESFGAPTTDATSSYCVLTRVFTNGSGGTIAVQEIGLYVSNKYGDSSDGYFCVLHDALTTTATVLNGQALTLNYTVKCTL